MNTRKISKMLFKTLAMAGDLVYPRFCELCNEKVGSGQRYICWNCLPGRDPIRAPLCRICGNSVAGRIDREFTCSWCCKNTPFFDSARSAYRYSDNVKKAVLAYKYGGAIWLTEDLAGWLRAVIRTHYLFNAMDSVTFVPLHPSKKRKRTYNQSSLLAGHVAKWLGKPMAYGVLKRTRPDPTQTSLTLLQRRENVRGAFAVVNEKKIAGKNLLLIDDVMTSGGTVNECAKVLKKAGANAVYIATVARG